MEDFDVMQNKSPAVQLGGPISMVDRANDIERRIKILEDRYNTLRKKSQTTDESLLALERKFSREAKSALSDVLELKRDISLVNEKLLQFEAELKGTAKREDLKVLQAYVSFIEPMQFATREDVKAALKDMSRDKE